MTDEGLLQALREAIAPAHKSVGMMLSPESKSPDAAQSKLSRILAGELNIPGELIVLALRGPNPAPLHRWFARVARVEVTPLRDQAGALRERALVELVRVSEQLELIRSELHEADASERDDVVRSPLKSVEIERIRERGRGR